MILNGVAFLIVRFGRSARTVLRMVAKGQWRQALILLDQKMGLRYFDFAKASLAETGLAPDRAKAHEISKWELDETLRQLDISGTDSIIDVGCGKGAAMITMAKYPFSKIVGLDLSPEMITVARRNLSRLRVGSRFTLFCCDAATFTDLDEYSHIYFFNPFPCHVMESVMKNVKESLARAPRNLTIVYNTPDCSREILASGDFQRVSEYRFSTKAPVEVYFHSPARAPAALTGELFP